MALPSTPPLSSHIALSYPEENAIKKEQSYAAFLPFSYLIFSSRAEWERERRREPAKETAGGREAENHLRTPPPPPPRPSRRLVKNPRNDPSTGESGKTLVVKKWRFRPNPLAAPIRAISPFGASLKEDGRWKNPLGDPSTARSQHSDGGCTGEVGHPSRSGQNG